MKLPDFYRWQYERKQFGDLNDPATVVYEGPHWLDWGRERAITVTLAKGLFRKNQAVRIVTLGRESTIEEAGWMVDTLASWVDRQLREYGLKVLDHAATRQRFLNQLLQADRARRIRNGA